MQYVDVKTFLRLLFAAHFLRF